MAMTEEERRALFSRLVEALGEAEAVVLIDQLPSPGHEVATKQHVDRRFAELEQALRSELRAETAQLRAEMEQLRAELRAEMEQLRAELRAETGQLRAELRAETGQLRAELRAETGQRRAEMAELRAEMEQLRTEMADLRADMNDRLARHTRVTVGATVAMNAATMGVVLTALGVAL